MCKISNLTVREALSLPSAEKCADAVMNEGLAKRLGKTGEFILLFEKLGIGYSYEEDESGHEYGTYRGESWKFDGVARKDHMLVDNM